MSRMACFAPADIPELKSPRYATPSALLAYFDVKLPCESSFH